LFYECISRVVILCLPESATFQWHCDRSKFQYWIYIQHNQTRPKHHTYTQDLCAPITAKQRLNRGFACKLHCPYTPPDVTITRPFGMDRKPDAGDCLTSLHVTRWHTLTKQGPTYWTVPMYLVFIGEP